MGGYNASFPMFGSGSGGGGSSPFSNPYVEGLIPFLTGGAGFFGSSGPNTSSTGNSSSSGTTSQSGTSTTTPNLSPEQLQISKLFTQGLQNQYNQGTDLTPYKFSGLQSINQTGNNAAKTISNQLASRGLSYSPAAATQETMNTLNTGNQENQFLDSIPLLQHQLNQGNLQQLIAGFGALPTGSTTAGSSSGTTTQNQNFNQNTQTKQNPLAGLLSGFGSGLGLLANL